MTNRYAGRGIALMMGSNIFFAVMSYLVKLAGDMNVFMISQFRFVVGLALLGTLALFGRIRLSFVHSPLLFLRGVTGAAAVYLFYLAIARLGIGTGTVISYSFPAFASVFGAVFLKERMGWAKAAVEYCH